MPSKGKVLIVDDDSIYTGLIAAKLRILGFYPVEAGSLGGAFYAMNEGPFNVVLLDLILRPDSVDPVKTIMQIPRFKAQGAERVFAMTGAAIDPEMRKLAIIYDADDIVSKDATEFLAMFKLLFDPESLKDA